MKWNFVKDNLPEEILNQSDLQNDVFDDYFRVLVYTTSGYMIAKRGHYIRHEPIEVEDGVIEDNVVDYGWYWDVETGNSVRENPIYVTHWTLLPEKPY